MSHFFTIVILPKIYNSPQEAVTNLLRKYDENINSPAYDTDCECIGDQVHQAIGSNYRQEIDTLREEFHKSHSADTDYFLLSDDERDAIDIAWQKLLDPIIKRQDKEAATVRLTIKPLVDCEFCLGSGKVTSTFNQDSKWDWWTIGGRWTGAFDDYDPTKDPDNLEICSLCQGTGLRNDKLGQEARVQDLEYTCNGCMGDGQSVRFSYKKHPGDIATVTAVMEKGISPFAIVTPDGEWHQKADMGWWGITRNHVDSWDDTVKDIYNTYEDHVAVVVDCHI